MTDPPSDGPTLDPEDWPGFRRQAHRMLDDMIDYVARIRDRPVWQPIPTPFARISMKGFPGRRQPWNRSTANFWNFVLPYGGGNVHPGFMGWVQGGGTPVGMLAEMLAGGLNANLGGRDQAPMEVERQSWRGCGRFLNFPRRPAACLSQGLPWQTCWRCWWRALPGSDSRRDKRV